MQFNVPQFIDIEDKVVGPLSLKQFGYLAACGAVLFMLYRFVNFTVFIIVAIPTVIFALAAVFLKINGRPFLKVFGASIAYFIKPKIFVWKRKKP